MSKVKIAHYRLPSASKKRACLSSLLTFTNSVAKSLTSSNELLCSGHWILLPNQYVILLLSSSAVYLFLMWIMLFGRAWFFHCPVRQPRLQTAAIVTSRQALEDPLMKQCFDFLYCSPEDSWWRRWPTGKYLNYLGQGRWQQILITMRSKLIWTKDWKHNVNSRRLLNGFHFWLVERLLIGSHFLSAFAPILCRQRTRKQQGLGLMIRWWNDKRVKVSEKGPQGKNSLRTYFNPSRTKKKTSNRFSEVSKFEILIINTSTIQKTRTGRTSYLCLCLILSISKVFR